MKLTTQQKRIRAIKERLCTAHDELMKKNIITARIFIDGCIESLELLEKSLELAADRLKKK